MKPKLSVLYIVLAELAVVPKELVLGPFTVRIEKCVKILGIIFNEHMSWNDQVNAVTLKLAKCVGLISRHRHILPATIKRLLYDALFNSHLCYCFLVWGKTTALNMSKLSVLQKKMVRLISNAPFLEHTAPLFKQHQIVKISDLYTYKLLCCYKKAALGKSDTFLKLANLKQNVISYHVRYQPPWHVPFSRTHYGTQRIQDIVPRTLNYFETQGTDVLFHTKKEIRGLFT